jgi:long-chain fatty acid transport protein
VNDNLVIAGGLNVVYVDTSLVRHFGENSTAIVPETEAVNLADKDISYGWNSGLSYNFVEKIA